MSFKTYFDIRINDNSYTILETRHKIAAIGTLSRIHEVLQKGLIYQPTEGTPFTVGLSGLRAIADRIHDGFNQKLQSSYFTKLFGRRIPYLIQSITGTAAYISQAEQLYARTTEACYQRGTNHLSALPDERKLQVFGLLGCEDLQNVARVCRDTYRLTCDQTLKKAYIERAREFGYRGDDVQKAKQFMKSLHHDLMDLISNKYRSKYSFGYQGFLEKKYVESKVQPDGSRVLDFERTLKKMQSMTSKEIFQILLQHNTIETRVTWENIHSPLILFLISLQKNKDKIADPNTLTVLNRAIIDNYWGRLNFEEIYPRIELLIRLGADQFFLRNLHEPLCPWDEAIGKNCLPLLEACVECLPNLDKGAMLLKAATLGRLKMVEYLVAQDTPVDTADQDGLTPLHYAATEGYLDVCRSLLEKGASVDPLPIASGHTPLFFACLKGHEQVVKLLIEHGADVKRSDVEGATPLHSVQNVAIAQTLLENGAELEKEDSKGFTPLRRAVRQGNYAVAEFLLIKGADSNVVDHEGKTALFDVKNVPTIDLLFKHGARIVFDNEGKTPLGVSIFHFSSTDVLTKLLEKEKEFYEKETERRIQKAMDADQKRNL